MTYILVFKTIDGRAQVIDTETTSIELAIDRANTYTRGGEGIVEYAYLYSTAIYEYSYCFCEWEEA